MHNRRGPNIKFAFPSHVCLKCDDLGTSVFNFSFIVGSGIGTRRRKIAGARHDRRMEVHMILSLALMGFLAINAIGLLIALSLTAYALGGLR
jgi:hypothetical protein